MKTIKLYYKKGCHKCPQAKKMLMEHSEENPSEEARYFELIDIETPSGLAEAALHDVFSTPTVLIFRDNKEIKRIIGSVRLEDLE